MRNTAQILDRKKREDKEIPPNVTKLKHWNGTRMVDENGFKNIE